MKLSGLHLQCGVPLVQDWADFQPQILLPLVVYSTVTNADGTTAKILDSGKLSIAVACLSILTLIVFFSHFKMTKERVSILPNQQQK